MDLTSIFGVLELNPFGEAKEDLQYGQGYALIAISIGCVVSFGDPCGCRRLATPTGFWFCFLKSLKKYRVRRILKKRCALTTNKSPKKGPKRLYRAF